MGGGPWRYAWSGHLFYVEGAMDIYKYLSYCMYLPLHSCIHHNILHVDRSSTENTDLE